MAVTGGTWQNLGKFKTVSRAARMRMLTIAKFAVIAAGLTMVGAQAAFAGHHAAGGWADVNMGLLAATGVAMAMLMARGLRPQPKAVTR